MSIFLSIRNHGGKCCGIKHIEGFHANPLNMQPPIDNLFMEPVTAASSCNNPGKEYFYLEAPQESGIDRLQRFMDFLKEKVPGHLIEIVLLDWQRDQWKKELKKHDFIEVNRFNNSNSGSWLTVYHRVLVKE